MDDSTLLLVFESFADTAECGERVEKKKSRYAAAQNRL